MFPDVLKKHDKFDKLMIELEKTPTLKTAMLTNDDDRINSLFLKQISILKRFDLGAEDRARHYTSNLVKLGLANSKRVITEVGYVLLGRIGSNRDIFEKILPLNDTNIVYLRQLLKLRIYDKNGDGYYSPFCMALYALLKRDRISQDEFCEIVQRLNPYLHISDVDNFLNNYKPNNVFYNIEVSVPPELNTMNMIDKDTFGRHFTNKKSGKVIKVYYEFYKLTYKFVAERSKDSLDRLIEYYESNRDKLNKAFGYGGAIFETQKGDRPTPEIFLKKGGKWLLNGDLNVLFYERFSRSKHFDRFREYSDTTIRIFKATGLISFENGYAQLICKELCRCIFDSEIIKGHIFGKLSSDTSSLYNDYDSYETDIDSFYFSSLPLTNILSYSDKMIDDILSAISKEFGAADTKQISEMIKSKRRLEFECFIDVNYPLDKVKTLLGLFTDRSNDDLIKNMVCTDATVPTIYEYIVGIAWYYFSDKKIDLLASYNLTLSANFEPLTHAGGGTGDIVIYEENRVVMLEATLMNSNSQKRGEWEPVLRHSVNLKVEEDEFAQREVTTFFIANEFDTNSINIWKAVSSVPMQSSTDKAKFTEGVMIMPLTSLELAKLLEQHIGYSNLIDSVRGLFRTDRHEFDMNWRDRFIKNVFKNI